MKAKQMSNTVLGIYVKKRMLAVYGIVSKKVTFHMPANEEQIKQTYKLIKKWLKKSNIQTKR